MNNRAKRSEDLGVREDKNMEERKKNKRRKRREGRVEISIPRV
jgi:hypothetical protein